MQTWYSSSEYSPTVGLAKASKTRWVGFVGPEPINTICFVLIGRNNELGFGILSSLTLAGGGVI